MVSVSSQQLEITWIISSQKLGIESRVESWMSKRLLFCSQSLTSLLGLGLVTFIFEHRYKWNYKYKYIPTCIFSTRSMWLPCTNCISLLGLPWQNTTDEVVNNRHLFFLISGGWKSKSKVLQIWFSLRQVSLRIPELWLCLHVAFPLCVFIWQLFL